MSWQAQTAVRKYGQIRDINLLRFAFYLAEHADPQGCIDPAPNQETIAAEFHVSTRTVRSWLAKLVSLEVVEQTRVGSGPGRSSAYAFLLPMPEMVEAKAEKAEAKVEKVETSQLPPFPTKVETKPAFTSTFTPSEPAKVEALQAYAFRLEQQMAEMTQALKALNQKVEALEGIVSTFVAQKVEGKAEKGGSPTRENEPSNHLKDLKDLKEGDPLPPLPPSPLAKVEGPEPKRTGRLEELYDDPQEKTRARLIQELCDVWCNCVGEARPRLNGTEKNNTLRFEGYFTPAKLLLDELFKLDPAPPSILAYAQDLLLTKRLEMITAGFTPTKLSAVVPQVLADLERAKRKPTPAKKAKPVYQDADAEFYTSF